MTNYTDLRDKLPRHKKRKPTVRSLEKVDMIVVHCTDWVVTPLELAEYDIAPFQMVRGQKVWNHISKKGCPTITYHDMIDEHGEIYHTEYYKYVTWHAGKWNRRSVATSLIYKATNKGKPNHRPPKKAVEALQKLLVSQCLVLKVLPSMIKGHRELEDTGWIWKLTKNAKKRKSLLKWCPGQYVDMDIIRWKTTRALQFRLKVDGFYRGAIDGIFGPKSTLALFDWVPEHRRRNV